MNERAVQLNEPKPVPQGWRWIRLGEVCDEADTHNPGLSPDSTFRYIDISSINATHKRIIDSHTILGKEAPSRARQMVKTNDVLVATTRPNLNAVALVPVELDSEICSTGFCVLRPITMLDPVFLFYWVQTRDFVRILSGEVKGLLYPAVTDSQVHSIYIPLPPLPEQKRIAAKVQELMGEVERARTACEAQMEASRALPSSYLRHVFESEEAKGWERRRLGEVIILLKNGIVAEQNFEAQGFKITRIETISNGTIDPEKIGYVSLPVEKFQDFRLQHGDIVFSHINSVEKLGNCAIYNGIPKELFHGMNLLRIRVNESLLSPYFLFFWLQSDECRRYYTAYARRAIGQASLNQTDLRAIPVPLPDLSKQQRIISELKDKMAYAGELKASIDEQMDAVTALPQAILRKAFRGEL